MSYQTNTNALAQPVDWSVPVTLSDLKPGSRWPPERLRARAERSELLSQLWRGDLASMSRADTQDVLSGWEDGNQRPSLRPGPNYVLAAGRRVADILLASPPSVPPELMDMVEPGALHVRAGHVQDGRVRAPEAGRLVAGGLTRGLVSAR